jgi:hypothetical protein
LRSDSIKGLGRERVRLVAAALLYLMWPLCVVAIANRSPAADSAMTRIVVALLLACVTIGALGIPWNPEKLRDTGALALHFAGGITLFLAISYPTVLARIPSVSSVALAIGAAAASEEVIFRGALPARLATSFQKLGLKDAHAHLTAALLAQATFAAAHMGPMRTAPGLNGIRVFGVFFACGLFFSIVARTMGLASAVAAHASLNWIVFVSGIPSVIPQTREVLAWAAIGIALLWLLLQQPPFATSQQTPRNS